MQMARSKDAAAQGVRPVAPAKPASPMDTSSSDVEMDTSESSSDESEDDDQFDNATVKGTSTAPLRSTSHMTVDAPDASVNNEDLEDTDMDLDSSESDDEDDDEVDYEPVAAAEPVVSDAPSAQSQSAVDVNENVTDNLAPELQADSAEQIASDIPVRLLHELRTLTDTTLDRTMHRTSSMKAR